MDLVQSLVYSLAMLKLNIHQAKTHLSRYLKHLAKGETILLCKRNEPIAEIRPLASASLKPRALGTMKGLLTVPAGELLRAAAGGHRRIVPWHEKVKILLDTCTALWFAIDAPEVSRTARETFEDPRHELFFSVIDLVRTLRRSSLTPSWFLRQRCRFHAHGLAQRPAAASASSTRVTVVGRNNKVRNVDSTMPPTMTSAMLE